MTDSYKSNTKNMVLQALKAYGNEQESQKSYREHWEQDGKRRLREGQWEALEYLFALFNLNSFERFCVALALVAELEPEYGKLAGSLNKSGTPTAGFAMELYGYGDHWASFFGGSRLWNSFLEPSAFQKGRGKLEQPLKLRSRVIDFCLGQWENPYLAQWGRVITYQNGELASHGEAEYGSWSKGFLRAWEEGNEEWAFILLGPAGVGKKTQLLRLSRETGMPVFCADRRKLALLPASEEAFADLLWECEVHQAFLAVEHWNPSDGREEELSLLVERALTKFGAVILLSEEEGPERIGDAYLVRTQLSLPTLAEEEELWSYFAEGYPFLETLNIQELAGLFSLVPGQIKASLAGLSGHFQGKQVNTEEVKAFCRQTLAGSAGGSLHRVPLKFGWQDLILPNTVKGLLMDACNQVKCRYQVYETWGLGEKIVYGTGTTMVFSGSPGTGKTMAAQVLAAELGLELYQIDLATVVSKYIGETEKNLALVFEEGKKSQAILFFDEADVLFSKRTEVREANDKYSNMEAAFMLQRIEEYTGVVILATNYIQNIDEAFKRRITFLIEFPFPDKMDRLRLWKSIVPANMRLERDIDFEFLASRFALSGSQIKNSVRSGAFLAAGAGRDQVSMGDLLLAVQRELTKSGKKLSCEDFGEYAEILGWVEEAHGI